MLGQTYRLAKFTSSMYDEVWIVDVSFQYLECIEQNKKYNDGTQHLHFMGPSDCLYKRQYLYETERQENRVVITARTLEEYNDPHNNLDRYIIAAPTRFIDARNLHVKKKNGGLYFLPEGSSQYERLEPCRSKKEMLAKMKKMTKEWSVIQTLTGETTPIIDRETDLRVELDDEPMPVLDYDVIKMDTVYYYTNGKWEMLDLKYILHRQIRDTINKHGTVIYRGLTYLALPAETYVKITEPNLADVYFYIDDKFATRKITQRDLLLRDKIVTPRDIDGKLTVTLLGKTI